MQNENADSAVSTKKSQLGGVRWYWQLAICIVYSITVLIVVIAVVDSQGRPSQLFYKNIGLIWPIGFIGSWLIGRPRRCFLLSATVFAISAIFVFGISATGGGVASIASKVFLLDHADVATYFLIALIIGILNIIYRRWPFL
jgi:hypothetical protein